MIKCHVRKKNSIRSAPNHNCIACKNYCVRLRRKQCACSKHLKNYLFFRGDYTRNGSGGGERGAGDNWWRHRLAPGIPSWGRWKRGRVLVFGVGGGVFEQVEGISNTVNTGALDKTVLSYSSVGAHFHTRKMCTRKHTQQASWRLWPGACPLLVGAGPPQRKIFINEEFKFKFAVRPSSFLPWGNKLTSKDGNKYSVYIVISWPGSIPVCFH